MDETAGRYLHGVLRRLAVAAGAAILQVRGEADPGARSKADDSPVTRADLAADDIICAGLAAAFPGVAVVTEERPETHAAAGRCFLVDPLDGTREFLAGGDDFTVNIALMEEDRPVAGVVLAPATGRLFATAPGGGAVEETGARDPAAPGSTRRIVAAPVDRARLRVVASKSHMDDATRAFIARLGPTALESVGSSLKFCLIAAGEADIYPRFGPTMHWDTAAAHAVLAAAGGQVLRMDDLTPLRYPAGDRRNPAFLATGAFDAAPLIG